MIRRCKGRRICDVKVRKRVEIRKSREVHKTWCHRKIKKGTKKRKNEARVRTQ